MLLCVERSFLSVVEEAKNRLTFKTMQFILQKNVDKLLTNATKLRFGSKLSLLQAKGSIKKVWRREREEDDALCENE